jgi:anthranilate synthase/aminodeoxychorismate synthase-like glutamine amidotransferase
MHGKVSKINHDGKGIFQGVSNPTYATRYHSLVIDNLPEGFIVSATSEEDGEIMAIRHISLPIEGVQFHPESVMTYEGKKMLANFLEMGKKVV